MIMMISPAKNTTLLANFDFLLKNYIVAIGPINAMTPIINEKLAIIRNPRSKNIIKLRPRNTTLIKMRLTPIFVSYVLE